MLLKRNAIIKFVLLVLSAISAFWIMSDNILFSNKPTRSFYAHELIIALVLLVILYGLLIFFLIKQYQYKPSVISIGVLSILFIVLLIHLCFVRPKTFDIVAPNGTSYSFMSHITSLERFRYISQLFATFLMGFFVIDILPKALNTKEFKMLLLILLFVVYIFILISYITDFRSYINLITFKQGNSIYDNGVKAFFPHKTVFGYILMIGGFVALYLFAKEKKWYWLASVGIIFIHLVATLSKLAIIIFFIAAAIYLLYVFFSGYKNNIKRNKKILIIGICVLVTLLLIGVLLYFLSSKVKDIVNKLIYPSGYNTFTTRTWIWNYAFAILKQTSYSLGAGFMYFGSVLKQANLMDEETALINNTSQTHNAYISMWANGGILLLVAYILFIFILIQVLIKYFKINRNLAIFYGIALLSLLVYGFFEAAPIVLATSAEHMLGGAFVVSGLLMHYREETGGTIHEVDLDK